MKTFVTAPRMHFTTACNMILELAKTMAIPYIKLSMDNIVVPSFKGYGFASMQVPCVISKENPKGQIYKDGHMVVRIIDGRLVEEREEDAKCSGIAEDGDVYDAYGWSAKKVADAFERGDVRLIGRFSPEGMYNYGCLFGTLKTEYDRKLFSASFIPYGLDLYLIHTPAEDKMCIEVTQEMIDGGLKYWPDDWRSYDVDAEGFVDTTPLNAGDLLVISANGAYVCAASVARQTYRRVSE